jgi:hypothetical protein
MASKAARNIYRLLFALPLVVLLLAICRPALADGQTARTLVLTQVSDTYGQVTSYVNQGAIKIAIGNGKVYLVSNAPGWKVMFCNDTNKKMLSMSLPQWLERVPQLTYATTDWDRFRLQIVRTNPVNLYGRELRRYVFVPIESRTASAPSSVAPSGEYFVLEGEGAAKEACFIMQKALSCPKVAGIPVNFINHRKKRAVEGLTRSLGGDEHWLNTSKIEERVVPQAFFAYPSDYKMAKREAEVVDDKDRREHIESVLKDLLPNP